MEAVENDRVQESFEKTLASLTELITATLRQALPGRFEEAKKLCEVAQAISQARAKRATTQKETPQVAAGLLQQPPPLRGDEDQMMANPYNNVNIGVGGVQLVFTGRVGPAWKGTEADLVARFVNPKGFRFDRIEWRGKSYTMYFVKDA